MSWPFRAHLEPGKRTRARRLFVHSCGRDSRWASPRSATRSSLTCWKRLRSRYAKTVFTCLSFIANKGSTTTSGEFSGSTTTATFVPGWETEHSMCSVPRHGAGRSPNSSKALTSSSSTKLVRCPSPTYSHARLPLSQYRSSWRPAATRAAAPE